MTFNFRKPPNGEESECRPGAGLSDEEFANFCATPEEHKRLPSGFIRYADGMVLWIDGAMQKWTQAGYKKRFGFDPAPVYARMKRQKIVKVGRCR
jgi:hypothetical protein